MSELIFEGGASKHSGTGDVVFVHGLGWGMRDTWAINESAFWWNWMAQDRPDLCYWSVQYEVSPSDWKGSSMPLSDRAVNILALMDGHGLGQRPLCFVTHSMGGLLVKKLLHHCTTIVTAEYGHIGTQTKGVVFLSTPHSGSDLANLVSRLSLLLRTTVAIDELKAHAPQLRELNLWYRNSVAKLNVQTKVFYETQPTKQVIVVDPTSADPGIDGVTPIPVDANHHSICQPNNRNDIVYIQSIKFIAETIRPSLNSASNIVTEYRKLLITSSTKKDLVQLKYKVETLLDDDPHNVDARCLLDDIQSTLVRHVILPPQRLEYQADRFKDRTVARFKFLGVIASIGLVVGMAYTLYPFLEKVEDLQMDKLPTPQNYPSSPEAMINDPEGAISEWFSLVDQAEYAKAWSASSKLTQSSYDQATFVDLAMKQRRPLGAVVTRTIYTLQDFTSLPTGEKGIFRLFTYRTAFSSGQELLEAVTLTAEDEEWRVLNYNLRPIPQ